MGKCFKIFLEESKRFVDPEMQKEEKHIHTLNTSVQYIKFTCTYYIYIYRYINIYRYIQFEK